jgi:uncharacterized membrane protein YgcG
MRRFILSTAFLGFAAVASAQTPAGPQWSAFAGCWTPVAADGSRNIAANTPRVCVIPRDGNTAELLTFVHDTVTERLTVNADGRQQPITKQGCSGWERAEFSGDGRRLYLRGEQTCAGGLTRATSGIFAIATNGDWINAVNVGADSTNSVRVSRYAPSAPTSAMPAEIRDGLSAREMSDRTARVAAQREVSLNSVVEASRFLAAPTVEAWLAELEQDFKLDDKALIRLADEKVDPAIIDMLVAVSNPDVFSVRPTGAIEVDERQYVNERGQSRAPCFAPVLDPWAWYSYDPCDPFLRFGYYRSRYYRGYGYRYGYGYPYGFDPYYGGYYGGGYYGSPVIIVRGSEPENRGRMTSDGYRRDGSGSSSGSSTPRSTTSSSGSSGSSSSGSSSGSSSSGGSSGGSSSGRTATKKPPV